MNMIICREKTQGAREIPAAPWFYSPVLFFKNSRSIQFFLQSQKLRVFRTRRAGFFQMLCGFGFVALG